MADEFTKAALYGIKTFNKKVKEKIGIEKLIELLNEYERETVNDKEYFEYTEEIVNLRKEYLISKSFGFIKWLVENDKIDTSKYNFCAEVSGVCGDVYKNYGAYESLLMLLTIQDNPIDFLISILK